MSWNKGEVRDIVAKRAADLQEPRCPCGCTESVFLSQCHPTALLRVAYDRGEKVLILMCAHCDTLVAKIKVAE